MLSKIINGKKYALNIEDSKIEISTACPPKEKFKVATIIDTAIEIPPNTGLTYRLFNLSRAMSDLGNTQVWIIGNRNEYTLETAKRLANDVVRIHLLNPDLFYSPEYIAKILRDEQVDLVQFELSETALKLGPPLRRLTGLPIIQEIHDVEAELRESLGRREEVDLAHFMQYAACSISDAVISMTPSDHNKLINQIGIDANKISLLPNGVTVKPFEKKTVTNKPTLVFLGNFHYQPNQDGLEYTLAEVFPRLKAKVPDLLFKAIGMVPDEVRLRHTQEDIVFTGAISDMNIFWNELLTSDIGLCILFSGSGMKVKILDYCQAALPIITTPVGVSGYETNPNLIIVEPEVDALVEQILILLSDKQRCEELGFANFKHVQDNYDWNSIAKKMEEVYRRVLSVENSKQEILKSLSIPLPFWFTENRHAVAANEDHILVTSTSATHGSAI